MSDGFRNQVFDTLNQRETDDLVEIWKKNDRVEWSELAFDVMQEILQNRLEEVPRQNKPIFEYVEENARKHEKSKIEKEVMKRVWQSFLFNGLPMLFGFAALAISLSLGSFIMGFAGVITIIRKESTSARGTIRGPMAIVLGVLVTIICWGASTYFLWVEISIGWWRFRLGY